jgi:hypothetical protein
LVIFVNFVSVVAAAVGPYQRLSAPLSITDLIRDVIDHQLDAADAEAIAGLERAAIPALAVDVGAVRALEVHDLERGRWS